MPRIHFIHVWNCQRLNENKQLLSMLGRALGLDACTFPITPLINQMDWLSYLSTSCLSFSHIKWECLLHAAMAKRNTPGSWHIWPRGQQNRSTVMSSEVLKFLNTAAPQWLWTIKLFSLLLHDCQFSTVLNHNVNTFWRQRFAKQVVLLAYCHSY